jgi:TonB family protein
MSMLPIVNERDKNQRSLGCLGFSMMAHVGILTFVALAPQSKLGDAPTNSQASAVSIDMKTGKLASAAAVSDSAAGAAVPAKAVLHEVMLADSNDPTGIEVQKESLSKQNASKPAEAKPVAVAAPIVAKAARAKALPRASKVAVMKDESGDIAIKEAIEKARLKKLDDVAAADDVGVDADETSAEAKDVSTESANNAPEEAAVAAVAKPMLLADNSVQDTEEEPPHLTAPAQKTEPVKKSTAPEKLKAIEQDDMETVERRTAPAMKPEAHEAIPETSPVVPPAPSRAAAQPRLRSAGQGLPTKPGAPAQAAKSDYVTERPTNAGSGRPAGTNGQASGIPMGVQVRDVSELVQQPGNPAPPYPQQDRMLHREGIAVVVGQVQANGSVGSVFLEKSSGSPTIDRAALATFSQWKFKPGQAGMVRKPWNFQLTGNATEVPSRLRRIGQ